MIFSQNDLFNLNTLQIFIYGSDNLFTMADSDTFETYISWWISLPYLPTTSIFCLNVERIS